MHQLIISPFLQSFIVVSPGKPNGFQISQTKYAALANPEMLCPAWLVDAARHAWGLDIANRPLGQVAIVRQPGLLGYGRASYELNLGCNYDCKHCYLGLKTFEGLPWADREQILRILSDAGVLWLQLTGGEPTVDRLFAATYSHAFGLGIQLEILTNGSRLFHPLVLDLLTSLPPYRVTLSVYGATEESYDGLTQRPGSYKKFLRGLDAAYEAGISLELHVVITRDNAHEAEAMRAIGLERGLKVRDYDHMSPTIYGGAESLASQSTGQLAPRPPFTGCDAGHTSLHVDPHGKASICKIGREPNISLLDEGIKGLDRLGDIANGLLRRQGGCTGCTLSKSCSTCMPLVTLYRRASAPLAAYCQHQERR
ncbi:radical SAM protein [Actinoallomurus sp. NPDC050550]|uniref:radical SAM protein n=1 Tax=Actinoallomurus sp. NPDC050550 TaxID=3154937 RepID=UPI0033C88D52